MPADKKDDPTGQDGQQQPKPAIVSTTADNGGDKKFGGEFHNAKTVLEIAGLIVALIVSALGTQAWLENRIDNAVEAKSRSVLSDETILRKIAAQSRPSLIFDANGSILHDMGAVQYLKPDDIRVVKRDSDGPPLVIHIGFVRPVSYPPIVTPLRDSAGVTTANGNGLDWEFTINWIVSPWPGTETNDALRVYRLEIVP
jgi:hypothetical protein